MSRHRRRSALPAIGMTLGAVLAITGVGIVPLTSLASWTDAEYTTAETTTLDCASDLTATASGTLLSGAVLGTELSAIASVDDARAERNGADLQPGSGVAAHPLEVTALQALQLQLGGLLQLPLGADTGAAGQFASVQSIERAVGAAGTITEGGAIELVTDGSEAPIEFATLDLRSVLAALPGGAAPLVDQVAGLELEVGAVAASAELDPCDAQWSGASGVDRRYAVAGLATEVEATPVAALGTAATSVVTSLPATLNGLLGEAGVVASLTAGLSSLLSVLGLVTVSIAGPTITLPGLDALIETVAAPVASADGIVRIDPRAGTVRVDLAALLGPAYGASSGLNGLTPNTPLLLDAAALQRLTTTITSTLDAWVASIVASITATVLQATVTLDVSTALLGAPLASIRIDRSLVSLVDGTAVPPSSPSSCWPLDLGCAATRLLASNLLGLLGPLLDAALFTKEPVSGTRSTKLSTAALTAGIAPVLGLVGSVLAPLLGEQGLLGLTANVQSGSPGAPSDSRWTPLPSGRFDVAALRITALGALDVLALDLARASVNSGRHPY